MATHTDEAWAEARRLYEQGDSVQRVSLATGIPRSTIQARAATDGWGRADGSPGAMAPIAARQAHTLAAKLEAERKMANARAELAERLLAEAHEILDRAKKPTVYKEVKTVSDGHMTGAHVEVVDVELDAPTAADVRNLAIAFGIFVDKSQLLSGEATSRSEEAQRTPEERKARIAQLRDELAERRASNDS